MAELKQQDSWCRESTYEEAQAEQMLHELPIWVQFGISVQHMALFEFIAKFIEHWKQELQEKL